MGTSTSAILHVVTPGSGIPPGLATGLVVSALTNISLTLTWVAPTTGDAPLSYVVQRSTDNGASWSSITAILSVLTIPVTGLIGGTSYQFRVLTSNLTDTSISAPVSTTTLPTLVGAPSGLVVVGAPGTTVVRLAWTAPTVGTPPISQYTVLLRTPSGSGAFTTGPSVAGTVLTVDATGLTSGASYDFQVRATNAAGDGPPSATVTTSTASVLILASAPQNLLAGTVTTTSVQVSWTASASGSPTLSYSLQAALSGTTNWVPNAPTTSLIDTVAGLLPGVAYIFRVVPSNSAGTGTPSASLAQSTNPSAGVAPSAPLNPTVTALAITKANLVWDTPTTGDAMMTYFVEWALVGSGTWNAGPTVTILAAQVTGLTSATPYKFRVTASNSIGTGPTSAETTGTTRSVYDLVTWQPAGASAPLVFSPDNLTVTATGGTSTPNSSEQGCAATIFKDSGSWSFEVLLSTLTDNAAIGLMTALYVLGGNTGAGSDTNAVGYYPSVSSPAQPAQTILYNGVQVLVPSGALPAGDASGSILTVCFNVDTNQWWVTTDAVETRYGAGAWNDSLASDPATATGGVPTGLVGPTAPLFTTGETGAVVVLNGGTSDYQRIVPWQFLPLNGSLVTTVLPGAPSGLVTSLPTDTTMRLTWVKPSSGTPRFTYHMQWSLAGANNWRPGGDTFSTTGVIPGLTPGTAYDFRVLAANPIGTGAASNTSSRSTTITILTPGSPSALIKVGATSGSLSIQWAEPTSGTPQTGFQLQYKLHTSSTYTNATPLLESRNGDTIISGGGVLRDASNHTYGVSSGGQVVIDGVVDSVTSGVDGGKYWAHQFWQHTSLGWWGYLGTPGSYTPNQADPALSIPASSTFTQTIAGLVANTAYDFQVRAFNLAGNGPFSTPVFAASTNSVVVGPTPPAIAAAVGFNTRTLGPQIIMGSNWFPNHPGANITVNSDGSVTLFGPWDFNAQITSGDAHSFGTAFGGGGLFEAEFSWANPYDSFGPGLGWPSFWANAAESRTIAPTPWPAAVGQGNGYDAVEMDWYEYFSDGWSSTLWDWGGGNFQGVSGAWFAQGHQPHIPIDQGRHKIAGLWVPATNTTKGRMEFYKDRVRQDIMTLVWDKWDPNSGPANLVAGGQAGAVIDVQHLMLLLGSSTANPMTVYSVEVWQRDGLSNLPPTSGGGGGGGGGGGSTPGPGTGPALQQPGTGAIALNNGWVASRDTQPLVFSGGIGHNAIFVKTYWFSFWFRDGEDGYLMNGVTAGFLNDKVFLDTPDVAHVDAVSGLPAAFGGPHITWATAGNIVGPVEWVYYAEPVAFTFTGAVFVDFNPARGDTFTITPNLRAGGVSSGTPLAVVRTETWGSWLDFSQIGAGWIAFLNYQMTLNQIGNHIP